MLGLSCKLDLLTKPGLRGSRALRLVPWAQTGASAQLGPPARASLLATRTPKLPGGGLRLSPGKLGQHRSGVTQMGRAGGHGDGQGPDLPTPAAPSLPAEKPYMVMHPDSKVRTAGQQVTLCCKASGTPVPRKYYW